jgi:hypothetical protein
MNLPIKLSRAGVPATVPASSRRPGAEYRGDIKTLPRAIDRYPAQREHIERLKSVGVSIVYGFFSDHAWTETAKAARVYRMPVDGRALGDASALISEVQRLARRSRWLMHDGMPSAREIANATAAIIRQRERNGTLLPMLFPDFVESKRDSAHMITLALPQPPADILETSYRVRLAGYDMRIGAPAEAIKVLDIEATARRIADAAMANVEAQNAVAKIDPILFAETEGLVIPIDMWGEPPTRECEALYRVLRSMAVQL